MAGPLAPAVSFDIKLHIKLPIQYSDTHTIQNLKFASRILDLNTSSCFHISSHNNAVLTFTFHRLCQPAVHCQCPHQNVVSRMAWKLLHSTILTTNFPLYVYLRDIRFIFLALTEFCVLQVRDSSTTQPRLGHCGLWMEVLSMSHFMMNPPTYLSTLGLVRIPPTLI